MENQTQEITEEIKRERGKEAEKAADESERSERAKESNWAQCAGLLKIKKMLPKTTL